MIVGEELKHFRTVVEEYRDDEPFMERLGASLAMTAIVMLSITCLWLAAPQAPSSYPSSADDAPAGTATSWASVVAACMRGDQFVWQDPHTEADFVAYCDVVELGKVGR